MWAVYIKEKYVYCPSLYTFPYNVFLYLLKREVHKDSKLGIMTMWVKAILSNINKISDACANSFGKYIWLHNVWETSFLFIKLKFLWKNGVSEKIKAHLLQHSQALQQLFSPHLFNFIEKFSAPPQFKKEGRDYIFYMKDFKGETIVVTILYDRVFIYRTVKS